MITKKDTGYNDDSPVEYWDNYTTITFNSSKELLEWIELDSKTLTLSDTIFDASLECLRTGKDKLVVATLVTRDQVEIDVVASVDTFKVSLSYYVNKLITLEKFERLSEIKKIVTELGFTFPTL